MHETLAAHPKPERLAYKWKVLVSVMFGIFMVILDTTVVNVAFQTLRREFGGSLNDSQWIISIYVLALGISTPVAGFLADRYGIRRTYVLGLAVFVGGSFLSGVSPSLWFLVAARALQGAGGGLAMPLGVALLFSAFPADEQGKALGIFGIALVTGPALGPILGGWLVDNALWRWIFFINLPIGLIGVALARRFLKEMRRPNPPQIDFFGLVTEVVGFGAVLYAASIAADRGWTAPNVLLFFGIGAVGLTYFAFVELYGVKRPLLDLRLFHKPIFALASLVGWVSVIALFGAEFLLPVYLQALRGYTAFETGLILLPLAIAAGFTTPTAGRLYDKIGPRPLIFVGFSVLVVNTWQLSLLDATTPIRWILVLLVLRGVALGMTVQTTFVTALSVVPLRDIARGSSLTNATRQVVQSIGVALLATVLASTLSPEVKAAQVRFLEAPPTNGARVALCVPSSLPLAQTPGASPRGELESQLARACTESVRGFERAYRLTFYFAILAAVIGLALPGWPFAWGGRRAADTAPVPAPG